MIFSCLSVALNINRHMYRHDLSGRVGAHEYIALLLITPLSETIEWCSLKSVITTLGLLFSWLHMLHCTVYSYYFGEPI